MAASAAPTPTVRNRLLSALPPEDLARLWPRLEAVELPIRDILHEAEVPVTSVYFPESGWASMLAYMESGDAAEVGLIGREGMVGLPVLLGADHDDLEAMVQCPGTALRMSTAAFRVEMDRSPAFRTLLLRYALVHHGQVAPMVEGLAATGRRHLVPRGASGRVIGATTRGPDQVC